MIFLSDCIKVSRLADAVFYASFLKRTKTQNIKQTIMRLSLLFFFLTIGCVTLMAANSKAQSINLDAKALPLQKVLKQIEMQSGYLFWYKSASLKKSKSVTINIKNLPLETALDRVFTGQPFSFEIIGETIVVKDKVQLERKPQENKVLQNIKGTVTDEDGNLLKGATITVKGTSRTTSTIADGSFQLLNIPNDAVLIVSYVGYVTQEIAVADIVNIVLKKGNSKLDEIQVIAYGTSSKRLSTGSVGSITAADIQKQPVSNPLASLSGRIPGFLVTQGSGISGSSFSMQIRGRNSFAQGSQPLILIDGIPFSAQNEGTNTLYSAITQGGGSLSPFASINPADIERIDVLKDADATAIYGSRGANGVILITTKRGVVGKAEISATFSQGFMQAPKSMELLSTKQYLEMRNEAFINSGETPDNFNAPDLTIWDQTRYTDLQKELTGNTAHSTNAQLSLSGGNAGIQYKISGGYNRETNVSPGEQPNSRGNASITINHSSIDKKFLASFAGGYSATNNSTTSNDLSFYTFLPPNIPSFFNSDGTLKWSENGVNFENPYGYLKRQYEAKSNTLNSSLDLSYNLIDGLSIKALVGFSRLDAKDFNSIPKSSVAPGFQQENEAQHGNRLFSSWNVEPQITYKRSIGIGKLEMLVGSTFHQRISSYNSMVLQGFSSEALMKSFQAATTVVSRFDDYANYRYQAIFGRVNYNIDDKYILNFTGRRDGSSRFGSGKRFANFGAVGAAYIFSNENWFKKLTPVVSFAKIHGSYGVTGNDQIGDYQYLDAWGPYEATYQGNSTLYQTNLYNADYSWEKNVKLEAALDLAFLKDRITLSVNYFRNRSGNQLVQYRLPFLTGYSFITKNFPATIDNKGWEFQLSATIIEKGKFSWKVFGNITAPKNTLVAFPNLETSNYAGTVLIGQPLNVFNVYQSDGIDPETGLYAYKDVDDSGYLSTEDQAPIGSGDPKFYGGIGTDISFKGFEVSVFADFRNQLGKNFLSAIYAQGLLAGTLNNQPSIVLDRWTPNNTTAKYEKFVVYPDYTSTYLTTSSLAYTNQSFIRLRTVYLGYNLQNILKGTLKMKQAKLFAQGQNLFTSTKVKGFNPETQQLYGLAPLQVFNFGIQITY